MGGFRNTSLFVFLCFPVLLFGQSFIQPLQWELNAEYYSKLSTSYSPYHSFSKPFLSHQIDSVSADTSGWKRKQHKGWVMRKIRNENLIRIKEGDFYLTIDPLFNFQFGRDLEDSSQTNLSTNTRGFLVQGAIGKKLTFYSSFYENQSFFPNYLNAQLEETGAVPGQGRTKPFKTTGYDYNMASAVLSYTPWNWLNIQLGHGKNFMGDGYRSLLLSDNTFNYPFLKATTSLWNNKIQYQVLYASLQDLERIPATTSSEAQFKRNAGTFHSLSYSPHKMVELSVFEGVVYQNWDSTGTSPLPWNFYVPVIGLNTAVEGMQSTTAKPVLGANIRVHPFEQYMIYGQFAMDHFRVSNTGFQFGVAAYNAFTLKNLTLQVEWNNISKGMYQHQNSQIDYAHYGGYLAHPSGNDLNELIGIIRYSWHDFFASAKWVYSDRRTPVTVDLGNGVQTTYRQDETVLYQDFALGYLVNHNTNMKIKLGYSTRNLNSFTSTEKMGWLYFSFITDLQNLYYDF